MCQVCRYMTLTMEMHHTDDAGGSCPVSSHQTVDQHRVSPLQGSAHKLQHGTHEQGEVLGAVADVTSPETHIEGVVAVQSRHKGSGGTLYLM